MYICDYLIFIFVYWLCSTEDAYTFSCFVESVFHSKIHPFSGGNCDLPCWNSKDNNCSTQIQVTEIQKIIIQIYFSQLDFGII